MEKIDLDILWILAEEEGLLLKVEDFLTHTGQSALSLKLNKLQQDVAVEIAAHLSDPLLGEAGQAQGAVMDGMDRFLEDANTADLHATPHLLLEYEPVTFRRLQVLSDVRSILETEGSEHRADYERLVARLTPLVPAPFPAGHSFPKPAQP